MARPWLRFLKVQGSNPTDAQKFFSIISFQIERLRDSIDGYCENDQIGLGRPPQEAQTSKSRQKTFSLKKEKKTNKVLLPAAITKSNSHPCFALALKEPIVLAVKLVLQN